MYRAIVIDDEKWTLMGICRTFHWEEEGFEQPFSTTDPEEGLAQILAAPPDAVFVDIRMPEMTGLELMATARQNGVASEFVIISGLQDFENARTAMKYAAFDYLLKPLDEKRLAELLARIRETEEPRNSSKRPARFRRKNCSSDLRIRMNTSKRRCAGLWLPAIRSSPSRNWLTK